MKVLGLDLSTHVGWSVFGDGEQLLAHGSFDAPPAENQDDIPDYQFFTRAGYVGKFVLDLIERHLPDFIFIEQTNLGTSRDDQKLLEFIHCVVLYAADWAGKKSVVRYVNSTDWRSALKISLTKDQKKHNKEVKAKKAALAKEGKILRSKKGEGKIGWKHLSVQFANEWFKLDLLQKDNDEADGIMVGLYGYRKMSVPQDKFSVEDLVEKL